MENRDAKDYQGPPTHSRGIRIPKSDSNYHEYLNIFIKF